MVWRSWKDWRWVLMAGAALVTSLLLADIAVRHFAWQVGAQGVKSFALQAAKRWDDFFEFAARHLCFQRTLSIYKELFDPKRREVFLRQSGSWVDEIRKSTMADFWVVTDTEGKHVTVLPLGSNISSRQPVWKAPLKNYPCDAALFEGNNGKPSFLGVGIDLVFDNKKLGELWLLYSFEKLSHSLCNSPFPATFELVSVDGRTFVSVRQQLQGNTSKFFSAYAEMESLPLLLKVSVPSGELTENLVSLRLVLSSTLMLLAVIVAIASTRWRRTAGGELAAELTEIFRALSERFLETRGTSSVFQELAEALVREFPFSASIILRFDEQTRSFRVAGYAPRRLIHTLLNWSGDGSELNLVEPILQRLQKGGFYITTKCWEIFESSLDEETIQTLQRTLDVRLCWLALLVAEGKVIGAIFVGTSRERFSDEEIRALQLVRQQAAMLITMVVNWEEQEKSQEQVRRFSEVLSRLNRELSRHGDLFARLRLIARETREALDVSQVSIWQISPDRQHACCVAAADDTSQQLEGTVLPMNRFPTYMISLEKERVVATDSVLADERTQELEEYWKLRGFEAIISASVWVEGEMVGVVCCGNETKRQWTKEEETFVGEIAALVAKVILEWKQQRRRLHYETLSQLALQLMVSTDWRGNLPVLLEDVGKAMNADRAFLAQLVTDEKGRKVLKCIGIWSVDSLSGDESEFPLDEIFTPQQIEALKVGKGSLLITETFPESHRQFYEKCGWGHVLIAPVFVESQWWGVWGVSASREEQFWSWDDVDVATLRIASSLLGSAIERQAAVQRQLEQEKQFRELVKNAVIGIYRSTPEGRFLMANEALARINGYSSVEELMSLDIPTQIYLNPEDRERFKKLMVERGFVSNYRYPIKRKDGSIGWVAKWARAVEDESGKVLYYEGFVLDITEQVRMEQSLKALQDIARSLVMRLDLESIIRFSIAEISRLYPNSAVLVFRYGEEDDVFVLESANEVADELLGVFQLKFGSVLKRQGFLFVEEKLWSGESIVVNELPQTLGSVAKDLSDLGYRSIFLRGIGSPSQLWGAIFIFRKGETFSQQDVDFLNTFCDYLSIAIRNALLFQQVQQAYDELRSVQEKMMEQERLRVLGQIASGIAHDINNALVPIQGFAEILLEQKDPVVRDAAEMIFKSARDIAAIVQRMREFYRPRSDEEVLEPVDLNAICKDALVMTRPRWFNMPRERGIVIETQLDLAEDLPPLTGIPNEIRQAIINLIVNAIDAMPEGGTLTIRTYRKDKGGRAWAVVEVSDTGIGMDEETKRRAIEPFFTTKGERGSGLGLSAVYGIVQRHEGLLEIESAPGEGTTVRLWFPSSICRVSELPPGEVPSLKLLVIDDEPSVREVIALLLRRDGHLVTTASDGEEGLESFNLAQLQGDPFNAVITDLGMPRMDGLSVARKIKEVSPDVPVILLTGWGFRVKSEEVKGLIDFVLSKPVTYQQLRQALSQIWRKRMAMSN